MCVITPLASSHDIELIISQCNATSMNNAKSRQKN